MTWLRRVNAQPLTTAFPVMTKSYPLPPLAEAAEWLAYCPETGKVTWRKDRWYNAKAGSEAGAICPLTGYRRIRFGANRKLQAHRIAWLLHFGVDPFPLEIDHIDGDRQNNRIQNLRVATRQQNQFNRGPNNGSRSGMKGVYPSGKKWRAAIRADGHLQWIGTFETAEEAFIHCLLITLSVRAPFAHVSGNCREPV
jgi:hypothetical protein